MWLETLKALSVLAFIPLFGIWGPLWSCVAVGVAFGGYGLASVWSVHRLAQVSMRTLLEPLIRPLVSCVPMALCVLGLRVLMGSSVPVVWRLTVEILAGAGGYALAALLLATDEVREMRRLLAGAMLRS